MNQASHFLDGSAIYGSTLKKSRQLREFEGGRLRVHKESNHEFLPIGEDEISSACAKNCYNSGEHFPTLDLQSTTERIKSLKYFILF